MLSVAIASTDPITSNTLRARLQQSGLVQSVVEWSSSTQHPASKEAVPDVVLLDLGRDPEFCFSFAANLRRLQPSVCVILCSTIPQPDPDLLLRAMRAGVQDFLPKPVDPEALQGILTRLIQEHGIPERSSLQKAIVVLGAKGGVGTTTLAVNLSVQLAEITKKRVLLLDLAQPLGHVSLMLDLQPSFSIRDASQNMNQLDSYFLSQLLVKHKSGLVVLAGSSHPDEWGRIPVAALGRLVNVAQSTFDWVLIDCGSVYSSEWRGVLGSARVVLLVTEAHMPDLGTLDRHLDALASLGLDAEQIRLVVNRWHKSDEEALNRMEKKLNRFFFARLPNDFLQVSSAVNAGVPLSTEHGDNAASSYRQLAAQLAGVLLPVKVRRAAFGGMF